MKTRSSQRRVSIERGFTLIEVVISSALMALILVSAYLCLNAGFAGQKLVEPRAEIFQNARVAMALMSADLRAACPLSKDTDFLGFTRMMGEVRADNLDFATHNYTPRHAREGDFCQASFYLDKDPESGQFSLMRRRNPTIAFDELSGGSKEEIARGVVGFKLEYYDGLDWYESWGETRKDNKSQGSSATQDNLSGLPEAVRITLMLDSNPKRKNPEHITEEETPAPPYVFQTVARLNLAAVSRSSSSSSSTNSVAPDATDQPGLPQGFGGQN